MASKQIPKKDWEAEEQQQESAVNRITNLPLLNSAFNLVSSAYSSTKEMHPCLSGVCNVAETVAAVAVGSVVGGAQPILNQLDSQIALANEYACKRLDQLEENLPFLQQPADKVFSDTKQLVSTKVTSAMDAACEAKEAVADKVTEAMDLTKNAVGDGVKLTRSMVTYSVNNAVEAAQGAKDLVTNKVTEAVGLTKHIVDDSIGMTKSAVANTIVSAVEAAQGARELVTNKVSEAVDLTKHIVEDSVGLTKSAVTSTIVSAVEAAQGTKDLVSNKMTEAVDLSKHVAEDSMELTKSAVANTIVSAVEVAQGAKNLVANKVIEAVDLTKVAVQDGMEKTKSAVASTVSTALDAVYSTIATKINTALEQSREAIQEGVEITNSVVLNSASKAKAVGQAVAGGVESVLGVSEDLVDHYLPMTEEELGQLATAVEGFGMASVEEQKQQQNYFVRLGSLSSKVRHRAYQLSLNKLQHVKQSTQNALSQLQLAINLIESVKKEVGQKLLDGQEKLHQLWVSWCLTQPKGHQVKTASRMEMESRTLAMLHIITQQLQAIYENLKVSIHGLPWNIQEAVHQATQNIRKLHTSFASANSFQDLSSTTLTKSRNCVAEAQRSLDVLFEYVTQNTPLNWLVGPFKATAEVSRDSGKGKKGKSNIKSLAVEKAASSKVTKRPEEPKGATTNLGEACGMLEKLEGKVDAEEVLAAEEIITNALKEDP
ncbi:perilipin-3-like isoform X2 [Tympanuchus pallidicinctus]|uniref:perilipin-3-like isoform X2 n=1 Tax=Tympanuchus pallidicinctus TaxID=109042 RepID=UPI002286D001|nr:perilipin-3-like isoform X2 [Tympanuchus pallidicinctus]